MNLDEDFAGLGGVLETLLDLRKGLPRHNIALRTLFEDDLAYHAITAM